MTFSQILLLSAALGWAANAGLFVGKPAAADAAWLWKFGANAVLAIGAAVILAVWL